MTSVYGVTYIGARDQIKRRLKERGAIADDSQLFGCSCYAAKVRKRRVYIFSCLSSLKFIIRNAFSQVSFGCVLACLSLCLNILSLLRLHILADHFNCFRGDV